jgi:MscS family membrane protein
VGARELTAAFLDRRSACGVVRLTIPTLLCVFLQAAFAQLPAPKPAATATPPPVTDPLERESPRGCIRGFLKAAEKDDYATAAEYLATKAPPARAQELARQLKVVLDRGLSGNLDRLPRTPDGDLTDGLPPNMERVGSVKTETVTVDVLLQRVKRGNGPEIWLFSQATLKDIPQAYAETKDLGGRISSSFLNFRILGIPLWRWLLILLTLALVVFLAFSLTGAITPLLRFAGKRLTGEREAARLTSLRKPLVTILLSISLRFLASYSISLLGRQIWTNIARLLAIVGVAWLVIAVVNIISNQAIRRLVITQSSDKIALIALLRRSFGVLVVLVAFIVLLHGAGVNVTAMMAGLGIGGVALALAAQKTLENFFGGIAIIMREIIRVGDFCKIADQTGTVEDVGFSSTRIRTMDRTVVSVSNAQVSQTSVENYTMRDKIWFHQIFGLASNTPPDRMRQVLKDVGDMLGHHAKVEAGTSRIRLIAFGKQSLDVEVYAYILETDFNQFLVVQEELLLRIMDIIAANGVNVAMPAQMTLLDRDADAQSNAVPKPELARESG